MGLARSAWETVKEVVSPKKPEPYKESKEKRSTIDQIKDAKDATSKALKDAGAD